MIKKNIIWIHLLIIIGFILVNINSCKQDEKESKRIPEIIWVNPADIYYGTILSEIQLNATADVAGTFEYIPPIGYKLNIGDNQILKVIFTPSDELTNDIVSKTVKINVVKKNIPLITWKNPANIYCGTLLSESELNATADVAGAFEYNPPIGSKLPYGDNMILKVIFTPTNTVVYDTVSKTAKINVTLGPQFTDIDGNVYHAVTIGTQVWMAENLKTTHFADGTAIPSVDSNTTWSTLIPTSQAYCWYDDNILYKDTYGALYTWAAAMNGTATSSTNPSKIQGVCPTGWHLPSMAEWDTLSSYLGGTNVSGGKLKEIGITHWVNLNYYATNETGFTGLPGGGRNFQSGSFFSMGSFGHWWTATEFSSTNAYRKSLGYLYGNLGYGDNEKETGYSVRCVKN